MLGHALVAAGEPRFLEEAIRELSNASIREPEFGEAFRHLAMAYGRKGNIGMAELSSAQAFFNAGDLRNAQTQASRAMTEAAARLAGLSQGRRHLQLPPAGQRSI